MEVRKSRILKAVIQEFTATATPVGSQVLASRHLLSLSSATIRSELADLAELGYLIQPHTSAGRIPTDRGYRYFVDFLMEAEPVSPSIQAFIDAEFKAAPADVQALVEKLATLAALLTENAAVVTAPTGPRGRIKHVSLVSLDDRSALLVLLLEGNLLRQQVIQLPEQAGQEALSRLEAKINRELAGKDRDGVSLRLRKLADGLEREVLAQVKALLVGVEHGSETLVIHDGIRNLLRQPEFADASRLHQVLEVLEETNLLSRLLIDLVGESELQIAIGGENVASQLRNCTVVLTTYGPSGRLKGLVGVVGPTRMRYGEIVGRLQAVAGAASDRMAELS
jgi:heat-inducible transcriptional repressor